MSSIRPPATPGPTRAEELYSAWLVDPERQPQPDLGRSRVDGVSLLEYLVQNKVPLLSLSPGSAGDAERRVDLWSDPLFARARQAEQDELDAMRVEYALVHDALAVQGIIGVFIKPANLAPSFPFKSDNLDVLYRPEEVERVRATLLSLGYVELTNMEEPHKYLFRKFRAGRSVSAIHLHEHVGWMTSFLDESALWQRVRRSTDDRLVHLLAPVDGLLTNLAHWFIEDKRLTLQDVVKYRCSLREGVDWDEARRIAQYRGWRDTLCASLLLLAHAERLVFGSSLLPDPVLDEARRQVPTWSRSWLQAHAGLTESELPTDSDLDQPVALPLRIPFWFSKRFSYAKLLRDPSRSPSRRFKDLVVHTSYGVKLRLHIHSQPSMLITISGVDGCGKTTQARALQSAFQICHLKADYVWYRGGSAGWLATLLRWLRPRRRDATPSSTEERVLARQRQFRSPWRRRAWSWLTAIELLARYTWSVSLPLWTGKVVICDRYVDDTLADWSAYFADESADRSLPARLLRWLTPTPGLSYWLDVPASVAQERSSDGLPTQFLEALSAAYQRQSQSGTRGQRALQRMDGTASWEDISQRIAHEVLTMYFANYHTVLNSLFSKNPGQWR